MTEKNQDAYNPLAIEAQVYAAWERERAFAGAPGARAPYCIVIPPPNVTGALHLGHALNNSIQDVLIRYHRMKGFDALWVPGTDHAGVATQSVVERTLWERERKTRYDVGRRELLRMVWEWKERYGERIIAQLKALGCSCDWERTRFTMDEGLSRAVRTVFVRLFHEGLVFRGKRLVNWCTHHRTALSNDELEYAEVTGAFYRVRYPLAGDPSRGIVVATTRPETMLGDTAVAVHPDDPRYKDLVGRTVILPLVEREIPVIADAILADPEKGTGAVKVTPAHDPYDHECGKRNGLPLVNILNEDGTINENGGAYRGLGVMAARARVLADLEARGLLAGREERPHQVAHCYRCRTIVEPFLSDQWFVDMRPLVALARRCAADGEVAFFPASRLKQFLDWLDSTPDWCISRQIWWGHRIPVWYCPRCAGGIARDEFGEPLAVPGGAAPVVPALDDPMRDPSVCPSCGQGGLAQDPDVLDTWFSSQLWPFSTLGWPDDTTDLRAYYPTSVLVTARDIIALWVARMVMMGKKFLGRSPFAHVYINGTILDEKGDIMSKSRGNGVDPIKLIGGGTDEVGGRVERYKTYGADALRYGIMSMATSGQDIRLVIQRKSVEGNVFDVDVPKMEEGRRLCNKIWQVAHGIVFAQCAEMAPGGFRAADGARLEDRWLSHRLADGIGKVTAHLDAYEIGEACQAVYRLFWDDFCSWYVELVKPRLWSEEADGTADAARSRLLEAFSALLRLLHPVMPFITERLWGDVAALRQRAGMEQLGTRIVAAPWPDAAAFARDAEGYEACEVGRLVAGAINSIKAGNRAIKEAKLPVAIVTGSDARTLALVAGLARGIGRLAGVEKIDARPGAARPRGSAAAVAGPVDIYVPLEGLVDFALETERLGKKIRETRGELDAVRRKLANEGFLAKAKPEVVEKERQKESRLLAHVEKLEGSLAALEALRG